MDRKNLTGSSGEKRRKSASLGKGFGGIDRGQGPGAREVSKHVAAWKGLGNGLEMVEKRLGLSENRVYSQL